MRNARLFTFALVIMSNSTLASCSAFSTSDDLCGSKVSVADFLASVQDGVAAIPDSQYAQVRMSAFDAYDATVAAMENEVTKSAASLLQPKLQVFIQQMDSLSCDFTAVADTPHAVRALSALKEEETLREANEVDVYMITRCGVASTLQEYPSNEVTLPSPQIGQPNDTLPTTNEPDEKSEAAALGFTVATAFGLTLTESEMTCLGTALTGVYDASGAGANSDQYTKQFQSAFDNCNIDFVVS